MKSRTWILILFLTVLALFSCFFYWKFLKTPYLSFSDAAKFSDMARQISKGEGYTTKFTIVNPPAFFNLREDLPFGTSYFPIHPLVLSAFFSVLGASDKTVIFSSMLFFILSSILTFLIGRELFSTQVGFLASVAFSLTIPMLEYASLGASEPLFVFETLLAFYLLILANKKAWILSGLVAVFILATRNQGPIYVLGLFIFALFSKNRELLKNFLLGLILTMVVVLIIGKLNGISFFPIPPASLFFEYSKLAPDNITLRGGINSYGKLDVFYHLKPLAVKTFYNLYNFYKSLPGLISSYLICLYLLSLLRWEKEQKNFRLAVLFILAASIFSASLTIPFMRYIHPAVPLIVLLGTEMLVWIISQIFKEKNKSILMAGILVLFFVAGQTFGQIFLDSRFLGKTVNQDKPPVVYLLGKMIGSESKSSDLVLTNVDAWGTWYGDRKTIWLPLTPDQLIPPNGEKTKIDEIFLTSYLANDPAQTLGEEWQNALDNPQKINNKFLKENFTFYKSFKIEAKDNYNKEKVYGVIFRRQGD